MIIRVLTLGLLPVYHVGGVRFCGCLGADGNGWFGCPILVTCIVVQLVQTLHLDHLVNFMCIEQLTFPR